MSSKMVNYVNTVSNSESRPTKKIKFVLIVILLVIMLTCMWLSVALSQSLPKEGHLASKVVKLLYEFENVETLEKNAENLEKYLSKDLFDRYDVRNQESTSRMLNVYLRLGNSPTFVIIESEENYLTSGRVVYTLNSLKMAVTRRFELLYHKPLFGKITSIEENELISFNNYDVPTSSVDEVNIEDLQ